MDVEQIREDQRSCVGSGCRRDQREKQRVGGWEDFELVVEGRGSGAADAGGGESEMRIVWEVGSAEEIGEVTEGVVAGMGLEKEERVELLKVL